MPKILRVDIELISELNAREHWRKTAARKKKQRQAVRAAWMAAGQPRLRPPIAMRLTRLAPPRRQIQDLDNLISSFKAVIDEVASIAGIDDKEIMWPLGAFMQRKHDTMGCEIEIDSLEEVGDDLTQLQSEFLGEWVRQSNERKYPPTIAQLEELYTWNGQQLMDYLVAKNYLDRDPGVSRGTRLTSKGAQWVLLQGK